MKKFYTKPEVEVKEFAAENIMNGVSSLYLDKENSGANDNVTTVSYTTLFPTK